MITAKVTPIRNKADLPPGQLIGMMPLRKNVGEAVPEDWKLQHCPTCGRECYYQQENGNKLKQMNPRTRFLCTECALKRGAGKEGKTQ